MNRKFLDTTFFEARKMEIDGNIDYQYWFDKSAEEKLQAASTMIAVAFKEPNFLKTKVDKTIFSSRKHTL